LNAIGKGKRVEPEAAAGDEGTKGGSERVTLKESPMHEHMEQDDYLLRIACMGVGGKPLGCKQFYFEKYSLLKAL
jgi:hypothetical protein